jgi:hypothetical protein
LALTTAGRAAGEAVGSVGWGGRGAAGALASEGANSVAPHIPQKRFSPGFSFPHREQRTKSPRLLDYDICAAFRMIPYKQGKRRNPAQPLFAIEIPDRCEMHQKLNSPANTGRSPTPYIFFHYFYFKF